MEISCNFFHLLRSSAILENVKFFAKSPKSLYFFFPFIMFASCLHFSQLKLEMNFYEKKDWQEEKKYF